MGTADGAPGRVSGTRADPGPGERRRRLRSSERRALILAAAGREFARRPYSTVSTADIAAAAGVTRGLLHHYFGSKRQLFLAVVRELLRPPTLPSPGDGAGASRAGAADAWAAGVDTWLALIEANADMWLLAIAAGGNGRDDELGDILDEARELTATRVLATLGLTGVETPELRAVVRSFGAMAEEVTREWLERGRLRRDQARTLLVGALPLLIDRLVPAVAAARPASASRATRHRVKP